MAGDSVGKEEAGSPCGLQQAQGHEADEQTAQERQVGGATGDATGAADYEAALKAKDDRIAELSAEATEALSEEIAALKQTIADERVEFALKSLGARDVRAARTLWDDYEGDEAARAAAMAEANPWLFAGKASSGATSQETSQKLGGTTGLKPAGASGGGGDLARWERIAGLDHDGE